MYRLCEQIVIIYIYIYVTEVVIRNYAHYFELREYKYNANYIRKKYLIRIIISLKFLKKKLIITKLCSIIKEES